MRLPLVSLTLQTTGLFINEKTITHLRNTISEMVITAAIQVEGHSFEK